MRGTRITKVFSADDGVALASLLAPRDSFRGADTVLTVDSVTSTGETQMTLARINKSL